MAALGHEWLPAAMFSRGTHDSQHQQTQSPPHWSQHIHRDTLAPGRSGH